jgi:hypothetical protein
MLKTWTTLSLGLWLCSGCADLLDIPDAPALIAQDPWECPAPAMDAPAGPKPEKALVRVHACNYITSNCSSVVTGLTASLCNKLDYNCGTPIQSGIHDVNGDLAFEVPTVGSLGTGFDGYLLVNSATELCTNEAAFGGPSSCVAAPGCDPVAPSEKCRIPLFISGLLFFNPPINADSGQPIVLPLVPWVAGASLLPAAGSNRVEDQSLGIVFATGLDCAGIPAPGLTFRVSPTPPKLGTIFSVNGAPSASAVATDESGIGGLLGVPPGFVQVSAYVTDPNVGGREVASIGVQVLPTSITYVALVPARRKK